MRQYPESEFDVPGLERAWEMTQDLEIHLTSCQVGISATSIAVGIVATPLYWFAKLLYPVIVLGDSVAKWTLGLFGVEMTGAWLETETDRVESRADLRHRLGTLLDRGSGKKKS